MGERFNPSDIIEKTDKDTPNPVVNSDPFIHKDPVDAALIHDTPMEGTIGPMDELLINEMHMTPVQEVLMKGTVAVVKSRMLSDPPYRL